MNPEDIWLDIKKEDDEAGNYRIRVYKTPAAYKKIKVLGWWLIEMWFKFFQFLLKKAPKSGLLGKKVVVYLNFD